MWGFFKRLLRVTTIDADLWPRGIVDSLDDLQEDDFARQRNSLLYRNSHWVFSDDVLACITRPVFGAFTAESQMAGMLDPERDDFNIILAFALLRMCCVLLQSIATLSAIIRQEWLLLEQWLANAHNSMFRASRF